MLGAEFAAPELMDAQGAEDGAFPIPGLARAVADYTLSTCAA
jgi:hypothetical protein